MCNTQHLHTPPLPRKPRKISQHTSPRHTHTHIKIIPPRACIHALSRHYSSRQDSRARSIPPAIWPPEKAVNHAQLPTHTHTHITPKKALKSLLPPRFAAYKSKRQRGSYPPSTSFARRVKRRARESETRRRAARRRISSGRADNSLCLPYSCTMNFHRPKPTTPLRCTKAGLETLFFHPLGPTHRHG